MQLLTNNVWGITTDHKQRIWVTGRNGISIVDKRNNNSQIFKLGEHPDYESFGQPTGIVEFSKNNFLISSFMPVWLKWLNTDPIMK